MKRGLDFVRRQPLFSVGAIVLGLLLIALAWGVYTGRAAMLRAEKRLAVTQREWAGLRRSEVAVEPQVAANVQAQVDRETAHVAALQALLRGGDAAGNWSKVASPKARTDAYFELAAFVERMRTVAREQGVAFQEEERFGFADYGTAGPEPEHIPVVFRQRRMLDHLLPRLFALGAQRIDRVERSRPPGPPAGGGRMATVGRDEFVPDGWTAPLPGHSSVIACRITFTAQTEVLRRWLNEIAGLAAPLVVRLVEVEPMETPATAAARDPAPEGGLVMIVPGGLSRFRVTVEYLDPEASEEVTVP